MGATEEKSGISRPVRRTVLALVASFVVVYLVAPQLAGARRSLSLLAHVNVFYLIGGIVLEAAAIFTYALLGRAVLPRGKAPDVPTLLRVQLATKAVGNVVPGGTAAGGALGYRLLKQAGVDGADVGFALATQSLGSAVVLNALLWIGLVVSIPRRGLNPLYLTAAIIGAVLFLGFGALVLLLTRGENHAARILSALARRIPFVDEQTVDGIVRRLAARVDELIADRGLLVRAIVWSTANWLLDAASLWVFLAAFGHRASIDGLIISFCLANVLAVIPITPGGLGVVEAVLTAALVGFGAPRGAAILGVISYRLVNYWLPIPLGALSYVSLKLAPAEAPRPKLRQLAEEAVLEAEHPRGWAARHGVKVGQRPPSTPEEPA